MRIARTAPLLLALLGSLPLAAGELKGRLVFADGKPAAGLTVSAVPAETPEEAARREAKRGAPPAPVATATSAADGRFAVVVPRPDAKVTLRVSGGVVPAPLDGVWEGSESEELPDLTVAKGEALAGKVVDAGGQPVAGARVTLLAGGVRGFFAPESDAVPQEGTTGADGTFRFESAAADGNTIAVEKEGFAPARVRGARSGALARPVALAAGAPLSGSALLPDRKGPAKGALVRWEGATATTRWVEAGEDGRFTIPNAPTGKGTLVVDAGEAGYAEVGALANPLAGEKPLVVALARPAALEGRVVDAKTSRALPRVKLVAKGALGARVVRSGPDGRYRIAPLAAAPVQLRADDARYVPWEKDNVALARGETKSLDVALTPGATLAGRVVDENGAPVADAKGRVDRGGQSAIQLVLRRARSGGATIRTAADGTFRATRLAPGDGQKLTMTHPAFETGSVAGLSLVAGGVKGDVRLVLRRGAALTGFVHDRDGNPVAGAEVALQREVGFRGGRRGQQFGVNILGGGDRPTTTTGADGRFTLAGVSPGEWAVEVSKQGWARERVEPVKVSEERTAAPLDVTLGPAAGIAGVVRSKGGTPLAGYFVTARTAGSGMGMGPGGFNMREPTGPDGAFVLDSLKAGTAYDLMAIGGGALMPQTKNGVTAPDESVEIVVSGNGRVSGRAVDEKTGRPLTDFTVSTEPDMAGGRMVRMAVRTAGGRGASSLGRSALVHDEDGNFTLEDVPAGTWSIAVEAKGYQAARVGGVQVEEGVTRENVEVRVSPGGLLRGRVTDARTGRGVPEVTIATEPVAGAGPSLVMLGIDDGSGPVTDADGRFEVDGLAPGRYKVVARHPDYAEGSETAELKESGGSVEIRLTSGSALGGVVLSETRQPVAGADVSLNPQGDGGFGPRGMLGGQAATTDASGRFRFEHLTAGRFAVTASLRSKSAAPADVVLGTGESKEDVVLTIAAGTTIRGTVSGLSDAQRAGVSVSGSGTDSWFVSTKTAADGTFELTGAPGGAVLLRAQAGDPLGSMRSASKQIVVDESQPVTEAEIVFEPGYALTGRVTKSGSAVAGAQVNANLAGGGGRSGSARADDSGSYRIDGLAPGRYNVSAFGGMTGGGMKSQTVDVAADQNLDFDFSVARLSGTVVEADSRRPLADVAISVADAATGASTGGGMRRMVTTDSNGRFSVEDLDAKSYTLTAQKPDYLFEKRDLAASEQGTDDLVIPLSRGQGIGIQVTDGIYRIPLRGVFVRVSDAGRRIVTTSPISLDANGVGEIPSLQPGVYSVWMDADGYAPVTIPSVNVPSSTVAVTMTPGGTVELHAGTKTLASGSARIQFLAADGTPYQMGPFAGEGIVTVALPIRRFDNFAPGSYVLQVTGGDSVPFTVREGQTTIVTLP